MCLCVCVCVCVCVHGFVFFLGGEGGCRWGFREGGWCLFLCFSTVCLQMKMFKQSVYK